MRDEFDVSRPLIVEKLRKFKDEGIIKILCGVRRSGKSTILHTYKEELLGMGWIRET